ncbi:18977_t:CDS:2, partial [Gigaspora rosea]
VTIDRRHLVNLSKYILGNNNRLKAFSKLVIQMVGHISGTIKAIVEEKVHACLGQDPF